MCYQIIDITTWQASSEYDGIYPKGAREKKILISPSHVNIPLKPNWKYLLKFSVSRHPQQFLSEILAYHIGRLCNITVPPAFIAYDRNSNLYGALIEWFYDEKSSIYIDGGDLLSAVDKEFDRAKGERHSIELVFNLFSIIHNYKDKYTFKMFDEILKFIKMLIFDALIGNTDRHQDNWGLIFNKYDGNKKFNISLSPAFDNGTSLCYEILEDKLYNKFFDLNNIKRYIEKGTHHIKYNKGALEKSSHVELIKNLKIQNLPDEYRKACLNIVSFDEESLRTLIFLLSKINCEHRFSEKRCDILFTITSLRKKYLLDALG